MTEEIIFIGENNDFSKSEKREEGGNISIEDSYPSTIISYSCENTKIPKECIYMASKS